MGRTSSIPLPLEFELFPPPLAPYEEDDENEIFFLRAGPPAGGPLASEETKSCCIDVEDDECDIELIDEDDDRPFPLPEALLPPPPPILGDRDPRQGSVRRDAVDSSMPSACSTLNTLFSRFSV